VAAARKAGLPEVAFSMQAGFLEINGAEELTDLLVDFDALPQASVRIVIPRGQLFHHFQQLDLVSEF